MQVSMSGWNWDWGGGGGRGGSSNKKDSQSGNKKDSWGWGGWGSSSGNKRRNNGSNNDKRSQFVKREDRFEHLAKDKQKVFRDFEINVIERTNEHQRSVNEIIKHLERLPDITAMLKAYFDSIHILYQKIEHYSHELLPFHDTLKREFAVTYNHMHFTQKYAQ